MSEYTGCTYAWREVWAWFLNSPPFEHFCNIPETPHEGPHTCA
jgi:hypothetical protein